MPKKGALGPNLGTLGAKLVTFSYSNAMVTIWAPLFEPVGADFILGADFGRRFILGANFGRSFLQT